MGFQQFTRRDALRIIVVLLLAVLLVGGVSRIEAFVRSILPRRAAEAFPTLTPASLIPPTLTPTSTATRPPTITPTPTTTPTPTSIPTSSLVAGEYLSFWNEFDSSDPVRGDWYMFPGVSVNESLLTIQGNQNWDGVYGNLHLVDGQTILVQFRYRDRSGIHLAVETGEWQTESYRSWGVGADDNLFSPAITEGLIEGSTWFSGRLQPAPDRWYVLMLYIGGKEPFVARIWDFENPTLFLEAQLEMDDSWAGLIWAPVFAVGQYGTLEITRYEELMP
ncbi:MAG: hypothetical protein Kow00124_20620 [Anaerolineae bacterium]